MYAVVITNKPFALRSEKKRRFTRLVYSGVRKIYIEGTHLVIARDPSDDRSDRHIPLADVLHARMDVNAMKGEDSRANRSSTGLDRLLSRTNC